MGKAGRLRNQRCKAENLGGQRSKEDRIKRKRKKKSGERESPSSCATDGSRFEDMEGVILIQCEEITNEQWSIVPGVVESDKICSFVPVYPCVHDVESLSWLRPFLELGWVG